MFVTRVMIGKYVREVLALVIFSWGGWLTILYVLAVATNDFGVTTEITFLLTTLVGIVILTKTFTSTANLITINRSNAKKQFSKIRRSFNKVSKKVDAQKEAGDQYRQLLDVCINAMNAGLSKRKVHNILHNISGKYYKLDIDYYVVGDFNTPSPVINLLEVTRKKRLGILKGWEKRKRLAQVKFC